MAAWAVPWPALKRANSFKSVPNIYIYHKCTFYIIQNLDGSLSVCLWPRSQAYSANIVLCARAITLFHYHGHHTFVPSLHN